MVTLNLIVSGLCVIPFSEAQGRLIKVILKIISDVDLSKGWSPFWLPSKFDKNKERVQVSCKVLSIKSLGLTFPVCPMH